MGYAGAMRHPNTGRPRLFTVAGSDGVVDSPFEPCDDGYNDACGTCNEDCTGGGTETLMIDATHLKTHRTATSMRLKKGGVAA